VIDFNRTVNKPWLLSLAVFFGGLFLFSSEIGNRPFFTRGEGREAIVVQDMLESGNYILPFEDLSDVPTKPPMFHWIASAASTAFGGMTEFSIRFPSALLAAIGLGLLLLVSSRSLGMPGALIATGILGTSLEYSRSAIHARVDMCFSIGIMCALVCLYRGVELWAEKKSALVWWFGSSVAMTFAVLSKGPAGIVIPGVVTAIYASIVHYKNSDLSARLRLILSAVGVVVLTTFLSGLWYYFAYLQGGETFVHIHFFRENLGRFQSIEGEEIGHTKPFYYSVIYLLIGFCPWSFIFPVVGIWLWQNRKNLKQDRPLLFASIWSLAVLLLVTVSQAKRDVYLLPAFPPLAYLFSKAILSQQTGVRCFGGRFLAVLVGALATVLFVALVAITYLMTVTDVNGALDDFFKGKTLALLGELINEWESSLGYFVPALVVFLALLMMTRSIWLGRMVPFVTYVIVASLAGSIVGNSLVLAELAEVASPKEFILKVRETVTPGERLYQYKNQFFPSMYYADRRVTVVYDFKELLLDNGCYILVRDDDVEEVLAALPGSQVLLKSDNLAANGHGKLMLVRNVE